MKAAAHRRPGWALVVRSLLELLVVSIFIVTFILQPMRIPTRSMLPTLRPGDFVLGNKQRFAPEGLWGRVLPPTGVQRGELAIFRHPRQPGTDLVKRVVALPGDRLRFRAGRLLLNEEPVAEPYAFYEPARFDSFRDSFPSFRELDPNVNPAWWMELRTLAHGGELTVPPGVVFVLGDNRNESEDSRYWGFVPEANLVAEPLVVYLGATGEAAPATTLGARVQRLRRGFHIAH